VKQVKQVVILGTIFTLVFLITKETPIHSDDLWYSSIGMDWSNNYKHYMTWSGRVVADYTSCILLFGIRYTGKNPS